jgi:hypothetical protein
MLLMDRSQIFLVKPTPDQVALAVTVMDVIVLQVASALSLSKNEY